MKVFLSGAALVLLFAGYTPYHERVASAHEARYVDEFGLEKGTVAYGDCRLALAQENQAQQRIWVDILQPPLGSSANPVVVDTR
jgi:hypothetical protein